MHVQSTHGKSCSKRSESHVIRTLFLAALVTIGLGYGVTLAAPAAYASPAVVDQGTVGTSEWTLYDDGLLEIASGAFDDSAVSPSWGVHKDSIVTIRLTGPVVAYSSSTNLFGSMDHLETIEGLELLDMSACSDVGYMFAFSPKLQSLDLSSWDVSNVVAASGMFIGSSGLEYLDISGWNFTSAGQVSSMFLANFEHPVKTLVLGRNSVNTPAIIHDAYLPYIPKTERYTGNWVGLDVRTVFPSVDEEGVEFLDRYNANPIPDTYVWQANLVANFVTNGGTSVEPQHLLTTDMIALPSQPTKDGQVFEGWYEDQALTRLWDFSTRIMDDTTLYARWSPAPKVTVHYVDGAGEALVDSVDLSGNVGEAANIEQKSFEGHEFFKATNESGETIDHTAIVFESQPQTITLHYRSGATGPTDPIDPVNPVDPALPGAPSAGGLASAGDALLPIIGAFSALCAGCVFVAAQARKRVLSRR